MHPRIRKSSAAFVVAALLVGLGGQAHAEGGHAAPPVKAGGLRGAIAGMFHREKAEKPAPPAKPEPRTPEQANAALLEVAQASGTPSYVGKNGRVYVNPHEDQHIRAMEQLSPEGSGILVIAQSKGTQHTKAIFEGQMLHFQYATGTNNWRFHSWGDRLRRSGHPMNGAMIQLTPVEAQNLRTRIAGIFAEEGPEHLAGPKWENGHIRNSVGVRSFNCTSGWCEMPIGENGESLGTIVGVPHQYDPYSANVNLERHGNERVFGIAIYGPAVPRFGMNPDEIQTKAQ
jgi:hypothetical protein